MPRTMSANLQSLLLASETHPTVDLSYADGTQKRFSDAPFTVSGRGAYSANLTGSGISEITRTRDSPVNRVSVTAQNVDRVLGLEIANDALQIDLAQAVIGRVLIDLNNAANLEWRELFNGRVVYAEADERTAKFDIVSETTAAGIALATKTLAPPCWVVFKSFLCGYAGALTSCNKLRKSSGGCRGRSNEHRFQGWEFSGQPIPTAPGAGGNDGGGIGSGDTSGGGGGGGGTCFVGETLVLTTKGEIPIAEIYERFERDESIEVFCFDPRTMAIHIAPVVNAFSHKTTRLRNLKFESGAKIQTTDEHNFHALTGKLAACKFRLGDSGYSFDARKKRFDVVKTTSIGFERLMPIEVFNLTVGFWHTYIANGCPVYNSKEVIYTN